MRTVLEFALPAALALAAVAAQAQTIETSYPSVTGNVGIAAVTPSQQFTAQRARGRTRAGEIELRGPQTSPANATSSALTRAVVRAAARVSAPRGHGHNA